MNRREALFSLGSMAAAGGLASSAKAAELHGVPAQTALSADNMPTPARRGGAFQVLTDDTDRATVKAVFDRLIPSDELGPSASEAGCLEFLDDQLAGDYGSGKALYLEGPLRPENEEAIMGSPQFLSTPRERYNTGLKALEAYAQKTDGAAFSALSPDRIDAILTDLEAGKLDLGKDVNGQAFFELMLQNVREGYLADPMYGGNKDMAGWKMIGFPGARYDYRPYVDRHDQDLSLTPVSIIPSN
ncbi:gluconate 2-dehydrogenase subunit 3 family protein [Pseudooceanicola sp. CBS1P-1]|uniref:Gluconate 2-dehydrogenase subunit 3 family protein n=1 Tax=Pseudooceanicola albus TaxID=2692189 RepID=A0A6L7FZ17_9RHOB|nr:MULTISPECIES: gluconate 2-dehydrogenase subunit 3 family protein [Pseudooceanicola]MBT9382444.1 gluconate 2-dehydrogenase subunit 3 family protein [Pseudooceanicola endophyticus]MXN16985.1 gluconate 2-dehydrogenase subunit 3 family protein [Pseudooceanicola albus]